ncbi:conserved hypothetical protein [Perkinsus marinus ATCC 50983]|uniref:Ribophorin II C-terminal domain-containing protein n=1 Tax=Perkinsus marinus (strain ATCC 50983 / TXsc) TaxID=423536 RepID=C5LE16_PERM5|nr:conserved hypothetical protein [Perkinsus marinus ATCC 50983]EER05014.1 conserved hypothetical protein [Perkinsus marinus ATCC 50983]|eukprot:XP_002773198.1 conserved hypothetical protein [Perkinsus marinus ATCC 50983]
MIIPLIIAVLAFPSVVAVAGDVAVLEKCVVKSNTDVIAVGWQSGSSTGTVNKNAVLSDSGHPSVKCDFTTAESYPAQVALMVTFKEGDHVVGAPDVQVIEMTRARDSSGTYTADIPMAGTGAITPRDGKYDLTILIGDNMMPTGVQQSLGAVPFEFHQMTKDALSKSSIPGSGDLRTTTKLAARYLPLPLIAHTFKPAQKTPPFVITAVFVVDGVWLDALTTVIPLLAFLRGLGLLKVNMELWKIDVHGMVFFGTLAAYLAVLGMFFLSLNLIQTMILCSLLLPIAIISGNKVLCQSRADRVKTD